MHKSCQKSHKNNTFSRPSHRSTSTQSSAHITRPNQSRCIQTSLRHSRTTCPGLSFPPKRQVSHISVAANSIYHSPGAPITAPTRIMAAPPARSEYLLDCDARSIQYGIQLIFGDWDQDLIVVNKPFGLPMAANHRDSITTRIKRILNHSDVFPVHRLDKYTSGCLVIALRSEVARVLQNSLQNHTLSSIKTTEANFRQKVKQKQLKNHLKATIEQQLHAATGKEDDVSDGDNDDDAGDATGNHTSKQGSQQHLVTSSQSRVSAADSAWSKRYRVLCQLSPCVLQSVKDFMIQQQQKRMERLSQLQHKVIAGESLSLDDFKDTNIDIAQYQGDISKLYLEYLAEYEATQQQQQEQQMQPGQATTQPPNPLHTVEGMRSPHQQGSVYTDEFSRFHVHSHASTSTHVDTNDNNNSSPSSIPPPLKSFGHIHSHLLHRDFLPTEWVHQNEVVHVEDITHELYQRRHSTQSDDTVNTDDQSPASFTNTVGIPSIPDIRVPLTHFHSSQLFLETSSLPNAEPPKGYQVTGHDSTLEDNIPASFDVAFRRPEPSHAICSSESATPLTTTTSSSPLPQVTQPPFLPVSLTTLPHNQIRQDILPHYSTSALRLLRDATEFCLLFPGAPKPPDNDDEEAGDAQEINKTFALSVPSLAQDLLAADSAVADPTHQKKLLAPYFSQLVLAEGLACAPFQWLNSKIQLFEQVLKLHVMSELNPKLVQTVYRKRDDGVVIPNFNLTGSGATQFHSRGKLLLFDTANLTNDTTPVAQDGNMINVHSANVFFSDADGFASLDNMILRQHPLYWTGHRIMFPGLHHPADRIGTIHNTENAPTTTKTPRHPLEAYARSHIINNTTGQKEMPDWPSLFPFEMECGCMLPYTTPLTHNMVAASDQVDTQPASEQCTSSEHVSKRRLAPPSTPESPLTRQLDNSPSAPASTLASLDTSAAQQSSKQSVQVFNSQSIMLKLPAPPPHPFIPTNYLYESVPPRTSRLKFIPNRNCLSLPSIIPDSILDEFDEKAEELKHTLDDHSSNSEGGSAAPLAKMKAKQARNNASVVKYAFDTHNSKNSCIRGQSTPTFSSVKHTTRFDQDAPLSTFEQFTAHNPATPVEPLPKNYIPSSYDPRPKSSSKQLVGKVPVDQEQSLLFAIARQEAKESTTLFRLEHLNLQKGVCMFHAKLLSGRTHQLRIHFSDAGCPIRGDPYYNNYYIKQWLATYVYSYYRQPALPAGAATASSSADALRSVHLRPLFGHADSGVTSQLLGVDTWNAIYTPLSNTSTPSIVSANAPVKSTPKSTFEAKRPDCDTSESLSQEQIDHYLDIYKAFAGQPLDGEMFLQSYLIEFPLPESLARPRGLKQENKRVVRQYKLQESLQNDLDIQATAAAAADVPTTQTTEQSEQPQQPQSDGFNPTLRDGLPLRHNRMTPEEVKEQRQRKKMEKKLFREKKEELQKIMQTCVQQGSISGDKFDAVLQSAYHESHRPSADAASTSGGSGETHDFNKLVQDQRKSMLSIVNDVLADHHSQAVSYANSSDDLSQFVSSSSSTNAVNPLLANECNTVTIPAHERKMRTDIVEEAADMDSAMIHPEGFHDVHRLFSSTHNPISTTIQQYLKSSTFIDSYNPQIPLAVQTLQPSDAMQEDKLHTITYAGRSVVTSTQNLLHLSTPYKSWVFKTDDGSQMVRILLDVPESWRYAM